MGIIQIDTLRILSTGRNIGLADPLKVLLYDISFGTLSASTNNVSQLSGFNYLVTNLQSQLKKKLAPPVTNAFFGKKKKDPASMYVQPNISYMSRMSARNLIEEVSICIFNLLALKVNTVTKHSEQVLPHLPSLLDRWESILTEQSQV
jgi:hypothetical protein